MRSFLISILVILMLGCKSYPKREQLQPKESTTSEIVNPYFSNPDTDYVYKASITVFKRHFGGLFIVKKIGENHHRVAFTTEMGNKIFDFSFHNDSFKVNYILEDINKPMLINMLKQDFKILITERLPLINTYVNGDDTVYETQLYKRNLYYYFTNNLTKIVSVKYTKPKETFHFSKNSDSIVKQIDVRHNNMPLQIVLTLIK